MITDLRYTVSPFARYVTVQVEQHKEAQISPFITLPISSFHILVRFILSATLGAPVFSQFLCLNVGPRKKR